MNTQSTPSDPGQDDDDLGHAGVRDLLTSQPPVGPMPEDVALRISDALADEQAARVEELGDDLGHAGVRDLLTSQPSPGPMPADVVARIATALAGEQATRERDGGLSDDLGLASVSPLVRPGRTSTPHTRSRWTRALTAAAAVAAVGVVGVVAVKATSSAGPDVQGAQAVASVHVQVSQLDYSESSLATGARQLITDPAKAATPSDVGPLATPTGLTSCLSALHEADADSVVVDFATFNAKPAAIIVVTTDGQTTAYAVQRDCSSADPKLLQDSVPVP